MEKQEETQAEHTAHSYSIYVLVWLGLLTLTALTTVVAGINFGALTIAIALLIASTKSYLVLTVFMHLRVEQKAFRIFILVALAFLIISFVLLFSDYSFLQGFIK
jgi:cytochrome c oxidase subunit 4